MSIKVLKAGMQTSIQDQGRQQVMHLGIAKGGAIDTLSMSIANLLLGNPLSHPVLEICLMGPSLLFTETISIAICGAQFQLTVIKKNGERPVHNDQTIQLVAGDILHFGKRQQGARAYLAFSGELTINKIMNSYSTHFLAAFGGVQGRALQTGDTIELVNSEQRPKQKLQQEHQRYYSGKYLLRCTDTVESKHFSPQQTHAFYHNDYKVSNSANRMGLRLEGPVLKQLLQADITSSGLLPGSIQIPANGLPIISSVDGQTIGGYPRIAHVITADLFALGQLLAGDQINFVKIEIDQAHTILAEQVNWLENIIA
ncbi:biotin-dependent carboxyltransferase family protein [Paraglaciecola sp. L3A3]|uniref:5-oxoprolinase subunit C family protein n=1 Tax=Paraglaciecola sp. L3A3 TaxID=2686358 RepID=UPI00131DBAE1|nr:biotin-dependent carboxyltransferase family protein [Paraglaciecola sp. L3A3]